MTADKYNSRLVEYEEGSSSTCVYKFEVKQDQKGAWHPTGSGAFYRVQGERMQFYSFPETTPPAEREKLEVFIRQLDPVQSEERGVLEIWIGRGPQGYFIRDYRWFVGDGDPLVAELPSLTRGALVQALERIDDMLLTD